MEAEENREGSAEASKRDYRLRDPVHGLITFRSENPLDSLAWSLIDTPEFQRLRRIKQLGVSEFVFPNATHTRFAHSIGVFHTARILIEIIKREVKENFDPHRAEVAVIAALLHDLGHGPFSHTFEGVQKARGLDKRHETWSAEIVRHGLGISPILKSYRSKYRSDDGLADDVAAMLEAEDPIDLYHAVVSSSFDADRLDYLQRDRLMTGTHAGAIDFDWLLEHVRVREVVIDAADLDDDEIEARVKTFCLDERALPAAEQFLLARYTLHEQVYFHKTTRCVEYMYSILLKKIADIAKKNPEEFGRVGLSSNHPIWLFLKGANPSLKEYLSLDDVVIVSSLDLMSRAPDGDVADLASRLRDRKLFKTLDIRSFGGEEGRQQSRSRKIDNAIKDGNAFSGVVYKDEGAKIGIYTQIGGDDEKMHKKLHIVNADGVREISTAMIAALAQKRQFTRYFFENESDRDAAKQLRKAR